MSKIPLYLTGRGIVKRENNTIVIRVENERPIYRPITGVLSLYNYGLYKWNTSLLAFLDDNYIPMHVFSRSGMYRGSFYNPPIPSSEVFVKQIEYMFSKNKIQVLRSVIKDAYNHNMSLIESRDFSTPYEKNIYSVFKGLMYASLVDAVYMTHLDPTAVPFYNNVGMPLVYMVFGIFMPTVIHITSHYLLSKGYKDSDFYPCKFGFCPRVHKLRDMLSYWEKIASSVISTSYGRIPRRQLLRIEFYKIEKLIMWDEDYTPFHGLWYQ